MSPAQVKDVGDAATALRAQLHRFHAAASEAWPGTIPPLNSHLMRALTEIAAWAALDGKRSLLPAECAGLRGLFLDPVLQAPPTPAPAAATAPVSPLLPEAAVSAVMGQLGAKGGASKSEKKIAAAKATLLKINAAKARTQSTG